MNLVASSIFVVTVMIAGEDGLSAKAAQGLLESQLRREDPTSLAGDARRLGDARRGALVFYQPALMCTRCHISEGAGTSGSLGPDLSSLGNSVPDTTLVEAILEEIASDCEQRVVTLGGDLDRIEDRVLADAVHDERRPLASLRRRTVRLHRRIGNLLIMIHRLDHQAKGEPAASLHAAVGRVVQRLAELEHELREMQERGRLLQEEIAAKLATETNNSLQAISVLTALFLPPTLIVGVFGMNTKGLPLTDDPDGFAWVILLSALCAAGTYWLLRRAPKLLKRTGLIR